MADIDGMALTFTTLLVGQGVGMFTTMMPEMREVRHTNPDNDPIKASDCRLGELLASTFTVGLGFVMSLVAGDKLPLLASFIIAGAMTAMYEFLLMSNPLKG